jgi:hypothetical protein
MRKYLFLNAEGNQAAGSPATAQSGWKLPFVK